MDYTSAPGYVTDSEGRRQFADLVPGQTVGTSLTAEDRNIDRNSAMYCVEQVGITPVPDDETQLWQALGVGRRLALPVTLGTPGTVTYAWPVGTKYLHVRGVAPGGAGGNSEGSTVSGACSAATGGGAGAEVEFWIAVANLPGDSVSLTIGFGGSPGTGDATAGGNGSNSVFGNIVVLGGGYGGGNAPAETSGFIGGQASGGAISWQNESLVDLVYSKTGNYASAGFMINSYGWPSHGANSAFGSGGYNSNNGNGGSGNGYGSGGAGAGSSGSTSFTGGYGAPGVWIITPWT